MTLTEFLSQPHIESMSDADALAAAQQHSEAVQYLIPCETINYLLSITNLRIALKKLAKDESSPYQNVTDAFIDSTFTGNPFNFTRGTIAGDKMLSELDRMINANITVTINGGSVDITSNLTDFKNLVVSIGNPPKKPFEKTTIEHIKAIRHPAVWEQTSSPDMTSPLYQDQIRFTVTPAETFSGQIKVRLYARKSAAYDWELQHSFPLYMSGDFTQGQLSSFTFKRPVGMKGMTEIKAEYMAPYKTAVSRISAEVVNA